MGGLFKAATTAGGAALGSAVPGLGTAVGAGLGSAVGDLGGNLLSGNDLLSSGISAAGSGLMSGLTSGAAGMSGNFGQNMLGAIGIPQARKNPYGGDGLMLGDMWLPGGIPPPVSANLPAVLPMNNTPSLLDVLNSRKLQ